MVAVFAGALLARRPLSPWRSWALAMGGVLVLDPWAPLGAGFWLSFGAVAAILAATTGRPRQRGLRAWLRVQTVISLALLPATASWLGHLPWLSPFANLLAVPWVSMGVAPPILLGIAVSPIHSDLAGALWRLADASLAGLMPILERCAAWMGAVEVGAPSAPVVALAALGAALLTAPPALPGRGLALPLLALLLSARPAASPVEEEGRIIVLDTGAGLAAVITAGRQALVYGAGPGGGLDAVEVGLLPLMEEEGLEPEGWIRPRDGEPWAGAWQTAQREWPQAVPIAGDGCAGYRTELGPLRVEGHTMEDGGCQFVVSRSGLEQTVVMRPQLEPGGKGLAIGTRGCGGEAPQKACSAAVREEAGDIYTTQAHGAVTLRLTREGIDWVTEARRRGRFFHRQAQ